MDGWMDVRPIRYLVDFLLTVWLCLSFVTAKWVCSWVVICTSLHACLCSSVAFLCFYFQPLLKPCSYTDLFVMKINVFFESEH